MILREDDYAAIISDRTIRSAIDDAIAESGADCPHEIRDCAARYLSDKIVDRVRDMIDRLATEALAEAKIEE